jgi:hypothetical protein
MELLAALSIYDCRRAKMSVGVPCSVNMHERTEHKNHEAGLHLILAQAHPLASGIAMVHVS